MTRALVVAAVMTGGWAGAQQLVVVGAGDCSTAALISSTRDVRDALRAEAGDAVMNEELVFDIVRPRSTRSVAELAQQLESARTLFYEGQAERAAQLAHRVLVEVERAPTDERAWATTSAALVLEGLIAASLGRPKELSERFRAVLRVEPGFKLDPQQVPPSAVTAFEAARREVSRSRKSRVAVRVSGGAEAAVFLEGRSVGTTPLELDLSAGAYRVSLGTADGRVSFPHRLEAPSEQPLIIDFAFEASVRTQVPLCVDGEGDASALKLAHLVAAERLVVVRSAAPRGEPLELAGAMYELRTGKKEREARVPVAATPALAKFLLFGTVLEPTATVSKPVPPRTTGTPDAPVVVRSTPPPSGGTRWGALAPLLGGGVAVVVGASMMLAANLEAATFVDSTDHAPVLFRHARETEALGTIGGVVFGVGLAVGIVGGLIFAQPLPVQPTVAFGPGGAALGLSGVWP